MKLLCLFFHKWSGVYVSNFIPCQQCLRCNMVKTVPMYFPKECFVSTTKDEGRENNA